ncbi:hypothetical protein PG985_000344 [Apiospora marii]|uniref:Uncharacterized protein n=1 Tax=Apiospora marii TaxID=335849 RepID=A0ABR1R2G0_9PEZI
MPKYTVDLVDILPRAGMIVDHTQPFLSSLRRDTLLLKRLRLAGVIGNAFLKRNEYRQPLDEALTGMMDAAASSEHLRASSKEKTDDEKVVPFLTFVEEVQARTTWASSMSASLFVDLFAAVLGARVAWKKSPRPPFAPEQHDATALAAQRLLDLAPAIWDAAQTELEFYKLAGGFDEDEDEKEGETPAAALPDPTEEENAAEGGAMEKAVAQGFEEMEVDEEGEKMDVD